MQQLPAWKRAFCTHFQATHSHQPRLQHNGMPGWLTTDIPPHSNHCCHSSPAAADTALTPDITSHCTPPQLTSIQQRAASIHFVLHSSPPHSTATSPPSVPPSVPPSLPPSLSAPLRCQAAVGSLSAASFHRAAADSERSTSSSLAAMTGTTHSRHSRTEALLTDWSATDQLGADGPTLTSSALAMSDDSQSSSLLPTDSLTSSDSPLALPSPLPLVSASSSSESRVFLLLSRYPVCFMLLFLLPSAVCLVCLFLPSGWSVSLDFTYDQFRIDGDSATWADNINAAARANSYANYKPATQTTSQLRADQADSRTINSSLPLYHSFSTSSLVGELPPPAMTAALSSSHFHSLQSAPAYIHRSYLGETLTVVYAADASAGVHNLLTSTLIRRIRRIEQAVMNAPGYQSHCRVYYAGNEMGQCIVPSTVLNFMYPTTDGSNVVFDGRGSQLIDPTLATTGLLMNGMNGFFDRACSMEHVRTTTLISQFTFGLPLPGYADITDRLGQQRKVLRAWLAATYEPILAQVDGQAGIRVLREGGDIVAEEVNAIVMRDLLTVLLSVALVLAYMVWHTRSLFLTLCSLVMMAASFPPVILAYRLWFGHTMSLMNVVSVWLILGIGTDDVFIFVDTWRLYAKRQQTGQAKDTALLPPTASPIPEAASVSGMAARLRWTHRKAASAMLVTSLTTAAGFFSTSVSLLLPIRQFGFFLGAVVCSNYVLVITFFPAAVIAQARYGQLFSRAMGRCCRSTRLGRIVLNRLSSHSTRAVVSIDLMHDNESVAAPASSYQPPSLRSQLPLQQSEASGVTSTHLSLPADVWDVEVSSIVSPPRSPTATIQLLDVSVNQSQREPTLSQALLTAEERQYGEADSVQPVTLAHSALSFSDRVAAALSRHSRLSLPARLPFLSSSSSSSSSCLPSSASSSVESTPKSARAVDRVVLGYFGWLCRVRWLVVLCTALLVALLASRIPHIQPPTELPQILPLDSNVEQLRLLKKTLACDRCVQGRLNYEANLPPTTCPISLCSNPSNFAGCEDVDCGEGGVCQLGVCHCKPGYFGLRCDGLDKCYGADCGKHGSCESSGGQCQCRDGWEGDKCEVAPVCAHVQCGEHGSCSNYDGSCQCLDQFTGSHCEVPPASLPYQPGTDSNSSHLLPLSADLSVHVFVVFGVAGVDMSAADNENPGRPLLDATFDAAHPLTQLHMLAMCNELLHNNSHARPDLFRCPLLEFKAWLLSAKGEAMWPIVPAERYHASMLEWMDSYSAREYDTDVGFSSSQPPRVVTVRLSTRTFIDKELSGLLLKPEFDYWDGWMARWNSMAPPQAKAVQASATWPRMKTELAFLSGTVLSLICSVVIVSASILLFTGNVVLMLFTTLCILSVVLCLLGLFVVWGWPLGAMEAISVPLVVGLAVDYCLHLSHAYNTASEPSSGKRLTSRRDRARQALLEVGPSITAAALTTVACMLVLLACRIVVFVQFGIILAVTLALGITFTLTTFLAALLIVGPNDKQGDLRQYGTQAGRALSLVVRKAYGAMRSESSPQSSLSAQISV